MPKAPERKNSVVARDGDWIHLAPPFKNTRRSRRAYREFAARLASLRDAMVGDELLVAIDDAVDSFERQLDHLPVDDQAAARAATSVLADLSRQGWLLRVDKEG